MSWYGVGVIQGRDIGQAVNADRPRHTQGAFIIDGVILVAASGSVTHWSCPYGTYILTPQPTGSTIKKLYRRLKIHGESYKTVWNVGRPGKIMSVGFDSGPGRQRRSIQIHCSPLMRSSGCVVMDQDNFQAFAEIASKKDDMALEVVPDRHLGVMFNVIQRQDDV